MNLFICKNSRENTLFKMCVEFHGYMDLLKFIHGAKIKIY